ncbi:lipid A 3-O-deacylase [Actimicrobium sp. GrIS 1.19]|uniref:acyloxyacyl hydrolase n=1 Tax=Actimicrobium sp. GrIS 1.19 TaxID=3071708 RepID=UPI002DF85DE5|nr:lipid A 3-O-deacylase [Actimicrobium sp. GrIS 1.19]
MSKSLISKLVVLSGLIVGPCVSAYAIDNVSAEVATGNKSQVYRLGAQWNMDRQWFQSDKSELWGYWDATIAGWKANKFEGRDGATQSFVDIGFTPTARWQALNHQGIYFESGLGPHINSDVYNNNGRRLSTHLQFGTHLGLGYVTAGGLDLALKIQHFSNGGIKQPNNGVNFAIVKVGYRF